MHSSSYAIVKGGGGGRAKAHSDRGRTPHFSSFVGGVKEKDSKLEPPKAAAKGSAGGCC